MNPRERQRRQPGRRARAGAQGPGERAPEGDERRGDDRIGPGADRRLDEILGTPGEPVSAASGVLTLHNALALLETQVESAGRPTEVRLDRYRILSGALQTRILSLNSLTSGSYARFDRGDTAPPPSTAFGATTVNNDSHGVDFGPWVRTFMAVVNRSWTIPRAAAGVEGRVVVTFVVHKSGSVTDIVVASPSDVAIFNDSARKAIFGASLNEPLPAAFQPESCPFSVTFYFNERPPQSPREGSSHRLSASDFRLSAVSHGVRR